MKKEFIIIQSFFLITFVLSQTSAIEENSNELEKSINNLFDRLNDAKEDLKTVSKIYEKLKIINPITFLNISNIIKSHLKDELNKSNRPIDPKMVQKCTNIFQEKSNLLTDQVKKETAETFLLYVQDFGIGLSHTKKGIYYVDGKLNKNFENELNDCRKNNKSCKISNTYEKIIEDAIADLKREKIISVDEILENIIKDAIVRRAPKLLVEPVTKCLEGSVTNEYNQQQRINSKFMQFE